MKKKIVIIVTAAAACCAIAAFVISKRRSYGCLDLDTREFDDCLEDEDEDE